MQSQVRATCLWCPLPLHLWRAATDVCGLWVSPVRFDEDGLPIYTEESLGIGQGGNTALCPFDCECCF